ncbi:MAG: ABC transporter ATP-binding protein [Lachnospiraceae bacterium]|nr:ABC transporter ATP-binding protein [Lachnospiraceae bacterium]
METKKSPLLQIKDMSISFFSGKDKKNGVKAVKNISFDVMEGEIVGIVGESGSGKSVTSLSIMGLLSENGAITGGSVFFNGKEISHFTKKQYQSIRGTEISMVFQEPMTSLNPVLTIGYQVEEMLLLHTKMGKKERLEAMIQILSEAGLPDAAGLLSKYPHELSGGMRQRVMIAMAMILKPKLLIADEPTTALDVTIQAKILELLKKMNETYGTTVILISHDLGVIKSICSRAVVMYRGEIVEAGNTADLFANPQKDYTKRLLFAASGTKGQMEQGREEAQSLTAAAIENDEILNVKDLRVFYDEKKKRLFERRKKKEAVKGVSFQLYEGEILGIVGESGCGKSSLAKALVKLQKDVTGTICTSVKQPQMVFQDPYGSLNPSKKIGWLLEEPLRLKKVEKAERVKRVEKILEDVGLSKEYADRYPNELSGGQRQRIAIALAVILNQKLIVLDEPVSALDVTVQAQILELLLRLRKEYRLSYVFISHDLSVVRKLCDRVLVMYDGHIVESGTTSAIYQTPEHPYTKKLLQAVLS